MKKTVTLALTLALVLGLLSGCANNDTPADNAEKIANVKLCDILKNVQKRTNEEIFVGPDYRPFILTEGIFDFYDRSVFLGFNDDRPLRADVHVHPHKAERKRSTESRSAAFFLAFALIGVISILEVITILVDGAPVHLRCLNILSNYLGFGLSPAVSACLVYALDKKTVISRKFKAAVGCEVVYLLLLTALLPSGMVFSVSEDNVYARGPYFAFYIVMYLAALAYLAVSTIVTAWEFQNRSRVLLYPLIVFLAAETIIQIALPQLHVTWLCVTLLSVLYFIYCSEMWNQLDALTGLLNQNSYLNRTAEMRRSGEVLVVFDVDDFKQVNDRYGHVKGDICLAEIAACIKKAYARHGYCYRMGGDEFCVLLRDGDREHACARDFVRRLDERRKELDFLPTVSFGSAEISSENVVTVKDRADHNMYRYKKERKAHRMSGDAGEE